MKATIIRIEESDDCTRGVLLLGGDILCCTLELPWKDNKKNVSCIPYGSYTCMRYNSDKFGEVFQIMDVEDRTFILIHCGNTSKDTSGCVVIGTSFGNLSGHKAVLNSRGAMSLFMDKLVGHTIFELEIKSI